MTRLRTLIAAVVFTPILAGLASAQTGCSPAITVSPRSGPVGRSVLVSGSDFYESCTGPEYRPMQNIRIDFVQSAGRQGLAVVSASGSGQFDVTVRVPPGARTGAGAVEAVVDGSSVAAAGFSVTAAPGAATPASTAAAVTPAPADTPEVTPFPFETPTPAPVETVAPAATAATAATEEPVVTTAPASGSSATRVLLGTVAVIAAVALLLAAVSRMRRPPPVLPPEGSLMDEPLLEPLPVGVASRRGAVRPLDEDFEEDLEDEEELEEELEEQDLEDEEELEEAELADEDLEEIDLDDEDDEEIELDDDEEPPLLDESEERD